MIKSSKKPIFYIRVSSQAQHDEGTSFQAQRGLLTECAAKHGWPMKEDDVFSDVQSGVKNLLKRNSQLAKVFALAKKTGRPVAVTRIDRLTRCKEVAEAFFDAGIKIFESQNNDYITRSQAISYLNRCEAERDKKRISQDRAIARKKARGEPMGNPDIAAVQAKGTAQTSLNADLFARELYPEIKRLRDEGRTFYAIAKQFNECGQLTAREGAWQANTVKNLVERIENPGGVKQVSKRLRTPLSVSAAVQTPELEESLAERYKDNPNFGDFA